MSSEEISLVSSQKGLNSQLLFQDDSLRFNCGAPHRRAGDPLAPKTRQLTGFIDDKLFSSSSSSAAAADRYFTSHHHELPRNIFADDRRDPSQDTRNWVRNGNGTSGDESDGDEEEDDDDDEEDEDDDEDVDDDDVDGGDAEHQRNSNNTSSNKNNSNNNNPNPTSATNSRDKIGNGKANTSSKHDSIFGSGGEVIVVKDGGGGGGMGQAGNNAVTVAEPDGEMYYSQYLQATEGSAAVGSGGGGGGGGKDVENGCGFSGRKEVSSSFSSESGECLRAILSDPVTGALMDDAVILPCGHSFGAGGMQHVMRMKACYTCSHSIPEDSIFPNLSLRAAVLAFRREEELQSYRTSKRRRERFDQSNFGDPTSMDAPRGRGAQFPFVVTDRVIIKGNKRTPQRFVGREAVVTTQCLNGWYVVKTLDNAESVKLQYRSLAKVSDDTSPKPMSSKMAPSWL